jgi:competence protein ComEA
MARRDPHDSIGRLAAVLDRRPDVTSVDGALDRQSLDGVPVDGPTLPLPVAAPRGSRRGRLGRIADRWLPAAWRNARLDPGRPGALALLVTAAVAAVVAAVGVWWEAPRAEPVPRLAPLVDPAVPALGASALPAAVPAAGPDPTPTAGPPEPLVVSVAGRVARPGLVRVPAGARVADVVAAAGGPLPGVDLTGVNLARRVSDGEQVAVGVPAAPDAASPPATSTTGSAAPPAPLDLNAATVEQLDALPGVGPVTAQRIVEWRTRNGRFAAVDQLREVEGIGERRFGQLRALVRT